MILPDVNIASNTSSPQSQSPKLPSCNEFELPSSPSFEDFTIPQPVFNLTPNLSADAGPNLYTGSRLTAQQSLSILFSWFSAYPGISKASFGHLLHVLHSYILPEENNLPSSYEDAVRSLETFLSPVKDFHCCVNDCVIFRKTHIEDYETLTKCPKCNEDRYKPNTVIPRKRFKYLPLEMRVRRLFANKKTSQLLQSHCKPGFTDFESNKVCSIHESEAWKAMYSSTGIYQGDSRGLSFALCMDGLNPFSREKSTYSTCPIFLVILNLPHHLRMLSASAMLTGLIAGPLEPKNTNSYVDLLVDDVMHLNTLTIWDGYKEENFSLNAHIVLNIFDYKGQNKVLRCHGMLLFHAFM